MGRPGAWWRLPAYDLERRIRDQMDAVAATYATNEGATKMPEHPEHWGHYGGTATHPPVEWVLSNQIVDLEKRIADLESQELVAVVAQRGGTIIYPVQAIGGQP